MKIREILYELCVDCYNSTVILNQATGYIQLYIKERQDQALSEIKKLLLKKKDDGSWLPLSVEEMEKLFE